jgi:AcrR family transcriptional regulator
VSGGEAGASRRVPTQQRSRERMEKILSVAVALIAAKGSEHLKMSEVAEQAGISIGSLYQYFPDKSSILRTLAERQLAAGRDCIEQALREPKTVKALQAAFEGLVDLYYSMFLAEPVMRDIWSGTQTDKELHAMELAESRATGAMLAAAMQRVHPGVEAKKIEPTAFLIWQLGEATMRLAIAVPRKEGDALVAAYKRMASREIASPGK